MRSTDLTNGAFTDRTYATLTVVPSANVRLASGSVLTWRVGITADLSNRDGSEVLPLAGLSLERRDASGSTTWALEYAATSQLPGYTALNSNPAGLFGGNPLLRNRKTAVRIGHSGNVSLAAACYAVRPPGR